MSFRLPSKIKKPLEASGSVKHHFQDYCASTSIHGVKYLGEENRPTGEKIWWTLVFVACIIGNSYLIKKVYNKWNTSPVIVSFAETTTPVWQVPFPAVTICSEIKSRARLFNMTGAVLSNATDPETVKKMGDVSLLCDDHVVVKGNLVADNDTIDFLIDVAQPFDDTFVACRFKKYISENCSFAFSKVFTEDGLCFSFNTLSPKELFRGPGIPNYDDHGNRTNGWTLENGYPLDEPLETYPARALFSGAKSGLSFVLKYDERDADYHCRGPVQGFKVLLHNPAEVPFVGERFLRVPLNQEVIVVVKPIIMTTSEGLKPYSPRRRQCYFPSERYLANFKIYTQRNCELECLTNFTLVECGCVGLHMPRYSYTPICGPGSKECMIEASEKLRQIEIEATYEEISGSCDCLPACTSLLYETETSQADYEAFKVAAAYGDNLTEVEGFQISRLTLFFKDMQFVTSKRSELYGPADFLANVGGLLGLFCGISILSIVELIYYVTLRLWGNMKRVRRRSRASTKRDSTGGPQPKFDFD